MGTMKQPTLSSAQATTVRAPLDRRLFLSGPPGTGKSTVGVGRLRYWLEAGVPAENVLVLTPQRTLAGRYDDVRRDPDLAPGGVFDVATLGGLARRMVDLFWPLAAEMAGFGEPDEQPTFLTLETAQYFMARVAGPLVDEGYFESIAIDRNRLYSQILDNLSKAAVVGFPVTEIAARLKGAWVGESSQLHVYDEAQEVALRFRRYCLEHNLLDFSLQVEVFMRHLWPGSLCRDFLLEQYTHLLVDNVEEDPPVAHDLLRDWLPHLRSALIIHDEGAGHRTFLGADPNTALALREVCDEEVRLTESFVTTPPIVAFGQALSETIDRSPSLQVEPTEADETPGAQSGEAREALYFDVHRFHPQMLDWVAETIAGLVRDEGVPPSEIVVLAPYLTDVLRFSLTHRLERLGVPARSHRPSRALRDEPATRALLTFAALAHPQWALSPTRYDVTYALMQAVADLDLVRAQLLTEVLYRVRDKVPVLEPFAGLKPEMQQRITYVLGGRYEALRIWFQGYAADPLDELDHFLARLFGELLSQPGFGYHDDLDAGRVAANLIESVQKFRWIAGDLPSDRSLGQEYVEMVQAGVVAAQYIRNWELEEDEAVLLAPAYTFLMANYPVDYQFWLNVGGLGWWERLYQPVTHPYVLSREWPLGTLWTDSDEVRVREQALGRLTQGLIARCRKGIFLGLSELGEHGYEQQGPLLKTLQKVLRNVEYAR